MKTYELVNMKTGKARAVMELSEEEVKIRNEYLASKVWPDEKWLPAENRERAPRDRTAHSWID